eukprot:evm.model.scf_2425.2 EVM.evm.TU.scf_2425.2   scf_2425:19755-21889(+)
MLEPAPESRSSASYLLTSPFVVLRCGPTFRSRCALKSRMITNSTAPMGIVSAPGCLMGRAGGAVALGEPSPLGKERKADGAGLQAPVAGGENEGEEQRSGTEVSAAPSAVGSPTWMAAIFQDFGKSRSHRMKAQHVSEASPAPPLLDESVADRDKSWLWRLTERFFVRGSSATSQSSLSSGQGVASPNVSEGRGSSDELQQSCAALPCINPE